MGLPTEAAAQFKAEVEHDLQFFGKDVGKTDAFGFFTQTRLEWYLVTNLLAARYSDEDSATHGERVGIFKEVTGIDIGWDKEEEKLIYPPHLAAIDAKVASTFA